MDKGIRKERDIVTSDGSELFGWTTGEVSTLLWVLFVLLFLPGVRLYRKWDRMDSWLAIFPPWILGSLFVLASATGSATLLSPIADRYNSGLPYPLWVSIPASVTYYLGTPVVILGLLVLIGWLFIHIAEKGA
jgi:hypothetical protein